MAGQREAEGVGELARIRGQWDGLDGDASVQLVVLRTPRTRQYLQNHAAFSGGGRNWRIGEFDIGSEDVQRTS